MEKNRIFRQKWKKIEIFVKNGKNLNFRQKSLFNPNFWSKIDFLIQIFVKNFHKNLDFSQIFGLKNRFLTKNLKSFFMKNRNFCEKFKFFMKI